ncbi:MAG: FecR domain-containing protein [bacterium]
MNAFATPLRCLLISLSLLLVPASWGDDWQYTVRPGERLWDIALNYCGSGRFAQTIADHNGITNSAQLMAGQRISIPTSLLVFSPSHASVSQVAGNVILQRRDGSQSSVEAGTAVHMGDHIISTEGAALVVFADGSQISIAPHSKVLFNKLTAFGPAGMVDTHLRFTFGQGEATVKPQNRGDRFRIQTPEGIAAVRGTQFRVGRSRQDTPGTVSTTETLEGLVTYTGQGQSTDVPAGFGVAASLQGVVRETLLPAPVFNPLPAQISTQTPLSWQPLPGAQGYIVEWARQAQADIVFASTASDTTQTLPPAQSGAYLLRVRGVSGNRIQGKNATVVLTVLEPAPTDLTESIRQDGTVAMQWQPVPGAGHYTITASADHWAETQNWQSTSTAYSINLSAGVYRWQVAPSQGATSQIRTFTVLPPPPDILKVKQDKLSVFMDIAPAAQGVRYRVSLLDRSGAVLQQEYSQGAVKMALPGFGRYQLQVASEQNSLHSEPVTTPIEARQKPWWMAIFIPLLAI